MQYSVLFIGKKTERQIYSLNHTLPQSCEHLCYVVFKSCDVIITLRADIKIQEISILYNFVVQKDKQNNIIMVIGFNDTDSILTFPCILDLIWFPHRENERYKYRNNRNIFIMDIYL